MVDYIYGKIYDTLRTLKVTLKYSKSSLRFIDVISFHVASRFLVRNQKTVDTNHNKSDNGSAMCG